MDLIDRMGGGGMSEKTCPVCHGSGWVKCDPSTDEFGETTWDADYCWKCGGDGTISVKQERTTGND